MLETIGELARERLQPSDDADEIGRRHAEWFLALAERAEQLLKGAEQPVWLQRLEDDHDNLRKSLDWLFDHDKRELAVRLAGALWLFWYMHGHVSEARRWLRRALDVAANEPTEARAKVLDGAGYLAAEQEDLDEAIPLLDASLSCAKEVGATSAAAIAAAHLGAIRARSQPSGQESRRAIAEGEEAVALARQVGDDYVLAVALNNLGGSTLMLLQDRERTSAYWAESLELRRRIGDTSRIALSLSNLGWMALLEGQVDRASSLFAEGAEIAGGIGDKRKSAVRSRPRLGRVSRAAPGGSGLARTRESRHHAGARHEGGYVDAMFCLAGTAAATGDLARGARLAAAAELHHSLMGPDDTTDEARYRAVVESARAACDPEIWERASAEGRAMSLDEAVDYALSSA
jgi:tetratricopeptide (TPR) repeat protein